MIPFFLVSIIYIQQFNRRLTGSIRLSRTKKKNKLEEDGLNRPLFLPMA